MTYKADPYAFHAETRPRTASRYYDSAGYKWDDGRWFEHKKKYPHYNQPVNIYEMHAGSWRKYADGSVFSYDKLGDELSALFIIISDTDATFNFLGAIKYTQLFNLLCTKADNSPGGKLTYHVRCLLDEFANIGEIPQFEKLIATIRSREISASIILQAKSQLKAIY